jgi:predicted nuclease of restriction endonuclease-like (RecB) superfamily
MGRGRDSSRNLPAPKPSQNDFDFVVALIDAARSRAVAAVNNSLIELYWNIGEHISRKVACEDWGQGTVQALAAHIRQRQLNARGFSAQNLWRMRQFFLAYQGDEKLSSLVRQLSWTHNLHVLGRCKRNEEREFYLRLAIQERWSSRQLERQIAGAAFERALLTPAKLSASLRELQPEAGSAFKDTYLLEFIQLPPEHTEADLERALVEKLRLFLIELGRDFCFVGSQYPLQVGNRDFALDLLFFNLALNCLVAFDLKIDEFQPEHLGKLEFYLEALDRDVKKPHEHPSIGVLLCKTKDREVVEYALSRAMSPALIAEYRTHLPDKHLLEAKLHEFYELAETRSPSESISESRPIARSSRTRTRRRITKQ